MTSRKVNENIYIFKIILKSGNKSTLKINRLKGDLMFSTKALWPCNTIYSCSCWRCRFSSYENGEKQQLWLVNSCFFSYSFLMMQVEVVGNDDEIKCVKERARNLFLLSNQQQTHTAHKTHRYDSFIFYHNDHDVNSRNTLFFKIIYLTFFWFIFSLCKLTKLFCF